VNCGAASATDRGAATVLGRNPRDKAVRIRITTSSALFMIYLALAH
jgi:hypothetical protein